MCGSRWRYAIGECRTFVAGREFVEGQLIQDESFRQLRAACASLNEKQQRVIELAYYQGLSQSRIAELLGQPWGTVKSWTRSALQSLRESMGEH